MDIPNAQTFLVGGAVRDELLGLTAKELDWVVVGSSAKQMLELGFKQVGTDFPVFLHPQSKQEYALARQERKIADGHKGFITTTAQVSLEEDLFRRDLSINAIAKSESGELIDPYGGLSDLNKRIFRHISAAFCEDPLRVLRVARFAAQLVRFNFSLAPETHQLLCNMVANGELSSLTPERVWKETEKALQSDSPRTYFEMLRSVGALKQIFPELDALFGIPQRAEFHPEIDAGLHTMLSLDSICEISADPRQRFAVLTHDLGKATTPKALLPRHPGHEERGAELTELLCSRLKIPNNYRHLACKVARHHLSCHRSLRSSAADLESLLAKLNSWQENSLLTAFTNCCMADARGRTGLQNRPYPQAEFLAECAAVGAEVTAGDLVQEGYKGKQIGEQIALQRAERITTVIDKYSHIDELEYARGNYR